MQRGQGSSTGTAERPHLIEAQALDGQGGVPAVAARVEERRPAPSPDPADILPFPASLGAVLLGGVALGGILGGLLGLLAWGNVIVIPGIETLFATGRIGIVTFCALNGVGLGIVVAGVASALIKPVRRSTGGDRDALPALSTTADCGSQLIDEPSRRDTADSVARPG